MQIARFIFSAIIAGAVVYLVFQSEKESSELLSNSANGFTMEMSSIPTAPQDSLLDIPITIVGPKTDQIKYFFRYAKPDLKGADQMHRFGIGPLTLIDSVSGLYQAKILTGPKGTFSKYYFEIRDPIGRYLNGIKISDREPLLTLAVGPVDTWIVYARLLLMFLGVLLITAGSVYSLKHFGKHENSDSGKSYFIGGALSLLIANIILTSIIRMQLTGDSWQGAPFGANLADNLVQILLAYLIFIFLISIPVKTKSGQFKTISPKCPLGYFGVGAFFLTLAAFLLPLFIKSQIPAISTLFYAVLAILLLTYLLMYRHTKNA